jgi:hypothetical protein
VDGFGPAPMLHAPKPRPASGRVALRAVAGPTGAGLALPGRWGHSGHRTPALWPLAATPRRALATLAALACCRAKALRLRSKLMTLQMLSTSKGKRTH